MEFFERICTGNGDVHRADGFLNAAWYLSHHIDRDQRSDDEDDDCVSDGAVMGRRRAR